MKKRIPQFPRRRLNAHPFLRRVSPDVTSFAIKLQPMLPGKCGHERLIQIRFRPPQLMIEVNNREDNPQLPAKLQQKPQQS